MVDSPPTSVLLPTHRWTDACGEIADQLRDIDERAFLVELRRTVSEDALLAEHLEVTPIRRTHLVPWVVHGTVERTVRWATIIWRHAHGAIAGGRPRPAARTRRGGAPPSPRR